MTWTVLTTDLCFFAYGEAVAITAWLPEAMDLCFEVTGEAAEAATSNYTPGELLAETPVAFHELGLISGWGTPTSTPPEDNGDFNYVIINIDDGVFFLMEQAARATVAGLSESFLDAVKSESCQIYDSTLYVEKFQSYSREAIIIIHNRTFLDETDLYFVEIALNTQQGKTIEDSIPAVETIVITNS